MQVLSDDMVKDCMLQLGGGHSAEQFLGDLNMLIELHFQAVREDPCHAVTATQQYDKLKTLLKFTDALLGSLRKIRFEEGEDVSINRPDYATALLIREQIMTSRWDALRAKSLPGENLGSAHLLMMKSIPHTYPSDLIDNIEEMRNAIDCAAQLIKPTRGNSGKNRREIIEQRDLTRNFVFRYRSRFGTFIPLQENNPEHRVFGLFLHAAALDGIFTNDGRRESADGNFSLLRKYVDEDKEIFKGHPVELASLTRERKKRYRAG